MEVRSLRAVAFSMLLLVSAMAGGVAFESQTAEASPPGFVTVGSDLTDQEVNPGNPPSGTLPSQAQGNTPGNAGETGQPTHALEKIPDHARQNVMASRGSIQAQWAVESSGKPALVVTDEEVHDGAEIAIPVEAFESSMGRVPEMAYGIHEDGTEWQDSIEVEGGNAIVEIPHFSTNTITWSGQFTLESDPATDGFSHTYTQSNSPANFGINITGVETTETDTVSAGSVTNGETVSADIAGNADPPSTTLTMEGNQYTGSRYTPSGTGTVTDVGISGDAEPSGPNSGEPEITFTGNENAGTQTSKTGVDGDTVDPDGNAPPTGPSASGEPEITFNGDEHVSGSGSTSLGEVSNTSSSTESINVDGNQLPTNGQVTVSGNGTEVHKASEDSPMSPYDTKTLTLEDSLKGGELVWAEFKISDWDASDVIAEAEHKVGGQRLKYNYFGNDDTTATVTWSGSKTLNGGESTSVYLNNENRADGNDHTVKVTHTLAIKSGGNITIYSSATGDSVTMEPPAYDGSTTKNINLGKGAQNVEISGTDLVVGSWDFSWDEVDATEDPSVDIDGDGTDEATASGVISSGQTMTAELSELDETSQTVDTKSVAGPSPSWELDYTTTLATEDPAVDVTGDGTADTSYSGVLESGETATKQLADLPAGTIDVDTSALSGPNPDWTITYDEELYTDSPAVDIDGDGTDEAAHTGKLGPGETAETSISPTLSDDTWDVSTTGPVDVTANITERTITEDVTVSVNGHTTTHSGTLSPGSTTSLTTDTAWINDSGENTVTVEVAPTLSPDAPAPGVDLYYTHDGVDNTDVSYTGEKFSERYNVSKTYATDQNSASIEIPFAGNVVEMRNIEYNIGGAGWTDAADYALDGTTLNATLDSVQAGEEVMVRATGSKVSPSGGEIQVTEPTKPDEEFESKIEVTSMSSDELGIDVGASDIGNTMVRSHSESWTDDAGTYSTFTTNTQTVNVPGPSANDTFYLTDFPMTVEPETGDVNVELIEASSEPKFATSPGPGGDGDEVAYTYTEATDGKDYILWSETNEIVRDSGTANSPITLFGDDSAEILQFLIDDTGTSTSSGDDTGTAILGPVSSDDGPSIPTDLLLYAGIALAVIVGFLYWRGGTKAVASATKKSASTSQTIIEYLARLVRGTVKYFVRHPYVGGTVLAILGIFALASGFITIPTEILTYVVIAGVPISAYYVLVRRLGASTLTWGMLSLGMILVGLQLLGTDVLAALTDWDGSVILVVGALFLANRAIKAARAPDEVNKISIGSDDD